LYRSRENRWIAGVCGGIAERYGWPANVVRLVYAVVSLLSSAFPGTLFYLVLWVCVPEGERAAESDADADDEVDDFSPQASHLSRATALALAALLGVLGAHRFYAGRFLSGALMLLSIGGLGIWWLVDVILVASGEFRDSDGRRLVYWDADPADDALYDANLDLLRVRPEGADAPREGETRPAAQQSTNGPDADSSSMTPTISRPARSSSSS
jgi:phage shock protein PspC (stress-responsive transcriptional regulator)